jgi:magnesium transporter
MMLDPNAGAPAPEVSAVPVASGKAPEPPTRPEDPRPAEPRDEEGNLDAGFLAAAEAAIKADDAARLKQLAGDLHEADLGALISALDPDMRPELVRLLGDDFDFSALVELDESIRVQLIEDLPTETVAEGVRELDSDDAVYILEDLDEDDQEAILDRIPDAERLSIERTLDYPEESAGRLMQTDLIAVPPSWTVGQTIDYCRETDDLPDDFYEIFVVDPNFRLVGAVSLDTLLRTKRPVPIQDIVEERPHTIRVDEDREEAAHQFSRYNLIALAVVDADDRLVGVITADDVVDVVQEEADEDIRALAGVGDEELSDTVVTATRSRFVWLVVNLITAFLAASVIGLFEGTIEKVVALAALAPIVASQGGNAATQTMTVAVRALATRQLGPLNVWRFVTREVLVGLLNGFAFAVLVGAAVYLWYWSVGLSVAIAGAMVINLLAGALAGVLFPLAIDRFDGDPAVISGAFVTTVTDCVGFFAILGIATWWFGLS